MGSKSTELIGANKGHDDTKHTAADADHSESPLRSQVDAALAGPPKAETAKADAPKEAPKPKDASDKTMDTAQANGEPDDPLLHAGKVNAIKQDLDAIARSGKTGDDVLQIGDRQMKVKDVVTELKKTLRTELEQAKTAAAAINQETVQAMLNGNISDRNNLAKELGLNPNLLTKEVIDAERAKAGSDPARRQKIDELDLNLQDRVEMEKLRHAPAFVKLVEAEMVAKGYDNPNLALGDKIPAEAQGVKIGVYVFTIAQVFRIQLASIISVEEVGYQRRHEPAALVFDVVRLTHHIVQNALGTDADSHVP